MRRCFEFISATHCTFVPTKSAPEDNPTVKRRNEEERKRKRKIKREKKAPVPPRIRHGRGTSKSTGARFYLSAAKFSAFVKPGLLLSTTSKHTNYEDANVVRIRVSIGRSVFDININTCIRAHVSRTRILQHNAELQITGEQIVESCIENIFGQWDAHCLFAIYCLPNAIPCLFSTKTIAEMRIKKEHI